MKRMIYKMKWWTLLGVVLFSACSRDYLRYDVNQKDGIYLVYASDSIPLGFSSTDVADSMPLDLALQVVGMPRDYDRKVSIVLVDSLTTAEENIHYRLEREAIVKAGEVKTYTPLMLFRNRDPEELSKRIVISFRLQENEDFQLLPGLGGIKPLQVILTVEHVARPIWWNNSYLGDFSEELYRTFMAQYEKLEMTNPSIYETIKNYAGVHLEKPMSQYLWMNYEYAMVKYIVRPLYDYYQENPHPDVNIPTPKY